ncbi:MAG: acyl carrier protein [Myxococcota bacterium]
MSTPDPDHIFETVTVLVRELTNLPTHTVSATDRLLEDLGMDSLQTMELLSRLSEAYDVDPDMDEVVAALTVGDVVAVLERALSQVATARATA